MRLDLMIQPFLCAFRMHAAHPSHAGLISFASSILIMPESDSTIHAPRHPGPPGYFVLSKRPLHILVFLLPLIIAYEIGLAILLRSDRGVLTNKAHESLLRFFDLFNIAVDSGLFLGGIAIVVVLFIWHLLNHDAWKVQPRTILLMALESIGLTLPLFVLGQVIVVAPLSGQTPPLQDLSIASGLAISVGAGLYEELLFRMVIIAVVHTLLVDLARLNNTTGVFIAILVSAAAFAVYHPIRDASGAFDPARAAFYFAAGLYFAGIFVVRGFGIVVAVHALYDIVTITIMLNPAE